MRRRVYVYFVVVFVLGIIIGAVGMYSYGWYTGRWHRKFSRHHVIEYLRHQLSLSDIQTQQLQQILQKMYAKESELHDKIEPQFHAIREETRAETRKILNPQQLQKFNSMVKRWDRMRKKHGPPPPPPPPKEAAPAK